MLSYSWEVSQGTRERLLHQHTLINTYAFEKSFYDSESLQPVFVSITFFRQILWKVFLNSFSSLSHFDEVLEIYRAVKIIVNGGFRVMQRSFRVKDQSQSLR